MTAAQVKINKKAAVDSPAFYIVFVTKNEHTAFPRLQLRDAEQEEAKQEYLKALRELSKAYEDSSPEGPFFFGWV
jgi:hypothetical protein